MIKDSLGDRMKAYEAAASRQLIARMPVIVRLDGKAFHSYLAPLKKKYPFSLAVNYLMTTTMEYLCENIQCCVFGYTQSDEITLILRDWDTHETQQWFGGNQTKIETIAASMATGIFNHTVAQLKNYGASQFFDVHILQDVKELKANFAMFDARAFNVPREDVTNNIYWRQQDAMRNSVQMLAQYHFPESVIHGKNNEYLKALLLSSLDVDWNSLPIWMQRGSCWKKGFGGVDKNIPVFKGTDRKYVDEVIEWTFKKYD